MTKAKPAAPSGAASPAAPAEGVAQDASASAGEAAGDVVTALTETPSGNLAAPIGGAGGDDDFDLDGRVIYVRSVSAEGRRRAGIAFGPTPQRVAVDDLTEDQLAGLLADPQLVVQLDD